MDARLPRRARAVALAAVASGVARIALPADYMLG
jgi:malate dehydrogenase (oxaloacetate-decarboxylating)(NADP+)